MPGVFGLSSEPGGRIAWVQRSRIMRPPDSGFLGFPSRDARRRFLELPSSSGPSELESSPFAFMAAFLANGPGRRSGPSEIAFPCNGVNVFNCFQPFHQPAQLRQAADLDGRRDDG